MILLCVVILNNRDFTMFVVCIYSNTPQAIDLICGLAVVHIFNTFSDVGDVFIYKYN